MGNQPFRNPKSPTKKPRKKKEWNPISEILSSKTIDSLKNKWERQDLLVFEERVKSKRRDGWTLQDLIQLFPRLKRKGQYRSGFSQETLKRIYSLFHRSNETEKLTNSELLEGLTLIKMSNSTELISRFIFYIYCDPTRIEMNNQGYLKFLKENKSRLRNAQLLGELEKWWSAKKSINPQQFEEIMAQFDIQKFKKLFEADFILQEQKLVDKLKVMKYLCREVGSEVYLVEFEWYLQWKDYMKIKYGLDPKIKEHRIMIDREKQFEKSKILFKSMDKLQYQYEIERKIKRPGVIPNSKLIGDQLQELRPGMKQFKDYVLLPAWLWSSLSIIFRGHPQIKRLYPQIYCLKVYQVFVDKDGVFIDNLTTHLQLCYNEMRIKEILNTQGLQDTICMHKYPGLQNWQETYNFDDTISKWNVYNCKIFICFVPKNLRDKFLMRYNVFEDKNGKKSVQERIKNYATLLHAQIHGILRQGFVIKISAESVYIEYRNEENSRFEKQIKIPILNHLNNNEYFENGSRNTMVGLVNDKHGQSFLHSLIQCLIRTPYFGKYLESVPKIASKEKNKQKMIIWGLSKIYEQSQSRKGVINVTKLTNSIQKKIPTNSDCFLKKLFYILEKQFKLSYKDIEENSIDEGYEGDRNVIIEQFFQTEGLQVTSCEKCCYLHETTQDIYTHTLALPEFEETQIFFYFFPSNKSLHNWLPIKYGMRVKYDMRKEAFMEKVAATLMKDIQKLVFYAQSEGEWKFNIKEDQSHKKVTEYVELGFRIICYQINSSENQQFELRNRRSKIGSRYLFPFSVPLLLEVPPENTWIDVLKQIQIIYERKYGQIDMKAINQRNIRKSIKFRRSLRSINEIVLQNVLRGDEDVDEDDEQYLNSLYNSKSQILDESRINRSSIRISQKSFDEKGRDPLLTNQYYTIRVFKKENPQHCFKCGKRFLRNTSLSQSCKGFCFREEYRLSDDQRILKHYNNVVITVDWLKYNAFDGFDHENDDSALQLANLGEEKKLEISQMLNKNPKFKQMVDCPNCQYQAQRQVTIKTYPNILIIQLKRFSKGPQGITKKQHRVFYDDILFHDGQKYLLYGILAHIGSPSKGKYFSIVKCDNYEEWFKCDEQRVIDITKNRDLIEDRKLHISQDAYILFYRRADMNPALMFYNPLI